MNAETGLATFEQGSSHEVHVFDEGASKGEIVFELSQRIPQNEYGLPIFFLRSDMLPGHQIADDEIDAATVGLFYYEGYPTLKSGATFWNQLPHEPQKSYELFYDFLHQVEEIGIRQLDLLAAEKNLALVDVADTAKEFYWSARARAYDLFIVAAEAKKRMHRIRKMEDTHFTKSEKLFETLMKRFEGEEFQDWIEELNAKEAIEVMEMLVKIQRSSVGLVGQHASSTNREYVPGESSEATIRRIAQNGGMQNNVADKFAQQLQSLLENPEEGATIQAAILKVTAPANRQQFDEDV
jgi:hypothetical protein